jgi:hypothetical protein
MPVVPTHHYQETYTKADLEFLYSEFNIPTAAQAELARALEDAAAICRWHNQPTASNVRPAVSIAALNKVAKFADKLGAALSGLPPAAQAALAVEYTRSESSVISALSGGPPSPKGAALFVPQTDGSTLPVLPDQDDIKDIIAHVARMAKQATGLPSGADGTKRNQGLRMWMFNIEIFWTETLGRSFTRVVLPNGEPLSQAARFCVEAFKPFDPKTPPSRVINEMKHCIKRKRHGSTGRIVTQNGA